MFGVANPIAEFDEGQREQVATHEAGHAVVSKLLLPENRITNLSIIRRGKGILGFMRHVSEDEIYSRPLEEVCAGIQISWGGDIACEMIMGKRWTGGTGDFDHVDIMMKALARHGYFADRLPLDPMFPFADEKIQRAANSYSDRMKKATRGLIMENQELVKDLRDGLLEHGELASNVIYETLERYGL